MHVGVMRIVLEIPGARSLKDKRQVTRSFKERVRSRLGISIAEIDHQDKLQLAAFGVAVVSADAAVCEEQLQSVTSMASSLRDALVADRAMEIVPFGRGGAGIQGGIEDNVDFGTDVDEEDADAEAGGGAEAADHGAVAGGGAEAADHGAVTGGGAEAADHGAVTGGEDRTETRRPSRSGSR